jgi:hypothetical protein
MFLLRGTDAFAVKKLIDLRMRLDGCGAFADANDAIQDCEAQSQIRILIDGMITSLEE